MRIFISGTGTNIGKTIICSWLCLQTGFSYFKPIQTGTLIGTDSTIVHNLSGVKIYKESFSYKEALSPHLASKFEKSKFKNEEIDIKKIILPQEKNLIVEGAGGVLVPINKYYLMVDLIHKLQIPVIIVASSELGTINHTLLTIEALQKRNIEILGIIMNGHINNDNKDSIEFYSKLKVLIQIPFLEKLNKETLQNIHLTNDLKTILMSNK